jgi:acetyl-CoA carboxylase biotin carboxylase subunit
LRVAAGERLGLDQADIHWRGSAIECRLYAEDPANNFFPSPGTIRRVVEPAGPGIRFDSGVYAGYTVPIDYDPLLAKLAAWAGSRDEAMERLSRALGETVMAGIGGNLRYLREILEDAEFRAGRLHTEFLTGFAARRGAEPAPAEIEITVAALAAALDGPRQEVSAGGRREPRRWALEGRDRTMR